MTLPLNPRRRWADVMELSLFTLVLAFALWTAAAVARHADSGLARWQQDAENGSVQLDLSAFPPLTRLWCARDPGLVALAAPSDPRGACDTAPWWRLPPKWMSASLPLATPPPMTLSTLAQWQAELQQRAQALGQAIARVDLGDLSPALLAEATPTSDGLSAAAVALNEQVQLEQQLADGVLRQQAQAQVRLARWSRWLAAELTPLLPAPAAHTAHPAVTDAAAYPAQLWALARALDGQGRSAGAQMVRQHSQAADQAERAGRLLAIVQNLLPVVALHWLVTGLLVALARARLQLLQSLSASIALGLASWFALASLGVADPPLGSPTLVLALVAGLVLGLLGQGFSRASRPAAPAWTRFSVWTVPGWWLFTAIGWLLLLDQSLNFHPRLRFLALEQGYACWIAAWLLTLAALAAPLLTRWIVRLGAWLYLPHTRWQLAGRLMAGLASVALLWASHRAQVPQYLTGEAIKLLVLLALCGWLIWKMPLAALLWHAGQARSAGSSLAGGMVVLVMAAAAAFLTQDKGPLLVLGLMMAVLYASVLGWASGLGLILLGFMAMLMIGVDLDVLGSRLQAWRDPFTADHDDMARLVWFTRLAAEAPWGFGPGQSPWCGTAALGTCRGLPLQLQSDYTFTALVGWWGPRGAWLLVVVFSLYCYQLLAHSARQSQRCLTPLALLDGATLQRAFALHLVFLVGVMMLLQAWITVAGNGGWLPLTGVTWPLISFGKTNLWLCTFFIGAWALRQPQHA